MKIIKKITCALAVLTLSTEFFSTGLASEAEVTAAIATEESGELYLPSEDAMSDVREAMKTARENDQLLLLVMGANWCHDSRALASRLHQEPLRSLVDEHYETVFVDLGYLDRGREVINSIGPPVYYATPTVLVVDPVNGRLVNEFNRHQWGHADTIGMEESVEYFQLMAAVGGSESEDDREQGADLQVLLDEIDAFERRQAERLYAAYAVIGPMLEAYKAGEEPEAFEASWNEVRAFRMQVPLDIDALRAEVRERVTGGESDLSVEFPEYPAFSWETK